MDNRVRNGGRWIRRAAAGMGAAALLVPATSALAQGESITRYGTLPDGGQWVADVPSDWNGTLIVFSHGFLESEPPTDAPDATTKTDLLDDGYALVGSTYQPSELWGLGSAVNDQFAAEAAVEQSVLPSRPKLVIALGQSMGGLVSALEDQESDGRINGALTTCGIVAGGVNLENYQLDGSYAISALVAPLEHIQLVGYQSEAQAALAGAELQQAAQQAQNSAQGRARLALASALYNVPTWTATDLMGQNFNPLVTPPPAHRRRLRMTSRRTSSTKRSTPPAVSSSRSWRPAGGRSNRPSRDSQRGTQGLISRSCSLRLRTSQR